MRCIAGAEHHFEPPSADLVKHSKIFSNPQGIMQWRNERRWTDLDARCAAGDPCSENERRRTVVVLCCVMFEQEYPLEPPAVSCRTLLEARPVERCQRRTGLGRTHVVLQSEPHQVISAQRSRLTAESFAGSTRRETIAVPANIESA